MHQILSHYFYENFFGGHKSFLWATDTPVLDFWAALFTLGGGISILALIDLMILGRKPSLTSLDGNLLLSCMVRFLTPTLISIGLKTTLGCLIFRNLNFCRVFDKICLQDIIHLSVSFTKYLPDVKQI